MSFQCLDPIVAVSLGLLDGKHKLKFVSKTCVDFNLTTLKERYGDDSVFLLPCGKCESCRRNRAEEWSIRSVCEAKCHPHNYFLTLTYDNDFLSHASDDDLSKFLDRLEGFKHKRKFKYLCCKEFGETTNRLHYHLVLFCDFEIDLFDPVYIKGHYHYHSKLINDLWKFGLHDISEFESNCARYVAKYTSKGGRLFMSRNLGKTYVLNNWSQIIDDNFILYGNFGKDKFNVNLPTIMLKWFINEGCKEASDIKLSRKQLSNLVASYGLRSVCDKNPEVWLQNTKMKVINHITKRRSL